MMQTHNRLPSQQFKDYSHTNNNNFFKTAITVPKTTGLIYITLKNPRRITKKEIIHKIRELDRGRGFDSHSLERTNLYNLIVIKELLS